MLKSFIKFIFLILISLTIIARGDDALFIDEPESLLKWQGQGFSLASLLNQQSVEKSSAKIANNSDLYQHNSFYRSLADNLSKTLADLSLKDPKLSTGMRTSHRLFNKDWLRSTVHRYDFVGIIFRPDRKIFQPSSCGELRFIYRLSYEKEKKDKVYSRLPMTLNLVFFLQPNGASCSKLVSAWQDWKMNPSVDKEDYFFKAASFKSLELNLQSVRWPSTIRPDMGGYAEYLLRVYKNEKGLARLSFLENTPNVIALRKDPKLKAEFKNWLLQSDNLELIDRGHPLIPEKFLTKEVTSVALVGVHRLANAPYTELFKEEEFKDINWAKYQRIKSPHGLLRRLNDLSCMGCHQGRTVAGFHFLGRDQEKTISSNSIFVAASAHFLGDQERRQAHLKNFLTKTENIKSIPFSVRSDEEKGRVGAHCGLGDLSFNEWGCEKDLSCVDLYQDLLISKTGICQPKIKLAGSACQMGKMKPHASSHRDKVLNIKTEECGANGVCEDVSVGFPAGMCTKPCQQLTKDETCGSIAILHSFNSCLVAGKTAFNECLENNVRPSTLMNCHESQFCRDDYICARTSEGKGACIPPYFLFQLRVDGHP
jgi:hypothetical protein